MDNACDRAVLNNCDAVTHRQKFIVIRRYQDDRFACEGKSVDQIIDRNLGTDIDTLCRFIEDQDILIGEQPACDHYFLLIATGEKIDGLFLCLR